MHNGFFKLRVYFLKVIVIGMEKCKQKVEKHKNGRGSGWEEIWRPVSFPPDFVVKVWNVVMNRYTCI